LPHRYLLVSWIAQTIGGVLRGASLRRGKKIRGHRYIWRGWNEGAIKFNTLAEGRFCQGERDRSFLNGRGGGQRENRRGRERGTGGKRAGRGERAEGGPGGGGGQAAKEEREAGDRTGGKKKEEGGRREGGRGKERTSRSKEQQPGIVGSMHGGGEVGRRGGGEAAGAAKREGGGRGEV